MVHFLGGGIYPIPPRNNEQRPFNFSYTLIDYKINFGIKLENNTWTGIIGDVAAKVKVFKIKKFYLEFKFQKGDIGFSSLFMSSERAQVISFSYPYKMSPVTFTSPVPTSRSNKVNLLEPFDYWIWISLISSIILIILLNVVFFQE